MTAYYKLDHSEPGYLSQMLPRADGSWVKRADYEADLAAARAEIERLTKERDEATSTVELVNSNNLTLAAELAGWKQSARQMEAERDEARAQVAALMQDRANLAQIIDNAITPNDADEHRLLLNGSYHTGPVVDWVHRVMIAMRDLLRKDPSKAKAALEAFGREKVLEGMKRVIDRLRHEGQISPSLTYADAIEWAEYVLATMEKEGGE